jgi:hypothetical protein
MTDTAFWKQLDAQNNENAVRIAIASGHYNLNDAAVAQEWLRRKEEARSSAAFARSEARDEESLSISRNALEISRSASRRALIAITLSTTMAIYEIIKWYSAN